MRNITSSDLANKGVVGLPDTPNMPVGELQRKFDEIGKEVIVPAFNEFVDEYNEQINKFKSPEGASEIGVYDTFGPGIPPLGRKTNVSAALEKLNDFTKSVSEKVDTDVSALRMEIDSEIADAESRANAYTDGEITGAKAYADAEAGALDEKYKGITDKNASDIADVADSKVDKVSGKGLSTNDLTNDLKTAYDDANSKKHTHSNLPILETITGGFMNSIEKLIRALGGATGFDNDSITSDRTRVPSSKAVIDYVDEHSGGGGGGEGDMLKSVYDTANRGYVDRAVLADTATLATNATNATKAATATRATNADNATNATNATTAGYATYGFESEYANALCDAKNPNNKVTKKQVKDGLDNLASLTAKVGDTTSLATTSKEVVGAINEVHTIANNAYDLADEAITSTTDIINIYGGMLNISGKTNENFFAGYLNGSYGFYTSSERGADTFHPFSNPQELYEALQYSGIVTPDMTYEEMIDAIRNRFPEYPLNTTWNFTLTETVEEFEAPVSGVYRFDVYGAKGGAGSAGAAGAGGHSSGYAMLESGDKVYVCVGGTPTGATGGYNGGGDRGSSKCGAGGGCTHIAKITGTLKDIGEGSKDMVLIVAGGGGGSGDSNTSSSASGGAGGGLSGANAVSTYAQAKGGTQTSGGADGTGKIASGFGYGSSTVAGGGGGFYGGGSSGNYNGNKGGAGGSGYIDGVPEFIHNGVTYAPATEVGGNTSNGYAIITYINIK